MNPDPDRPVPPALGAYRGRGALGNGTPARSTRADLSATEDRKARLRAAVGMVAALLTRQDGLEAIASTELAHEFDSATDRAALFELACRLVLYSPNGAVLRRVALDIEEGR